MTIGTFGKTTIGLEWYPVSNLILGTFYNCPENGYASKLTAYLRSGLATGERAVAAIYDPNLNLVAQTNEIAGPASGWVDFVFTNPPTLVAGTRYALVIWSNGTSQPCEIAFDDNPSYTRNEVALGLTYTGVFPSTLAGYGDGVWDCCIYCTYDTEPPAGAPPIANFTYTTNLLTVLLDASSSIAGGTAITSYAWDLGDGATGSGITTSHTYATARQYGITLTVTDADGLTDSVQRIVTVSTSTPPTANFTTTPTNLVVSFNASSSIAGSYPITTYMWDFGNGVTRTVTTPITSYTYATAGTYTVNLTVIDSSGISDAAVPQSVTVTVGPVVITGVTPWDSTTAGVTLETGTYRITMPVSVDVGGTIYNFTQWEDGSTNRIRTFALSADTVLNATYTSAVTTITLNVVAGIGGSVYPTGQLLLTVGQSYQFNTTESTGYNFDHWDLAGASKGSSPSIILTITSNMNEQTLTALFVTEPPPQVTITLAITGNGTTDIAPGSQIFNVGDIVTITAIPQVGATFNGWKLDDLAYSEANPLNLTVTADLNGRTLTAEFTSIIPPTPDYSWLILLGLAVAAIVGG